MQRTKLAQAVTTLTVGAALMAAASTSFAQSAVLNVTGTIEPAACTPTLSDGGNIDLGQVVPGKTYERKTALQITCNAPTFVAFKVTDNRQGTQPDAGFLGATVGAIASALLPNQFGASGGTFGWNDQVFGLGKTSKGEKIGGYSMSLGRAKVSGGTGLFANAVTTTGVSLSDSVPFVGGVADSIYKTVSGLASFTGWNGSHGLWITRAGGWGLAEHLVGGNTGLYIAKGSKYTAVNALNLSNVGDMLPIAGAGVANATNGTNFNFPITVRAQIAEGLSTGDSEKLDGQATFDLVYI